MYAHDTCGRTVETDIFIHPVLFCIPGVKPNIRQYRSEHRLYQVEGGSDNVCIGVETFNFCYPDAGPGADIEDLGGVAEGC